MKSREVYELIWKSEDNFEENFVTTLGYLLTRIANKLTTPNLYLFCKLYHSNFNQDWDKFEKHMLENCFFNGKPFKEELGDHLL